MGYRANVRDKDQSDIESAEDDSAIRFPSFNPTTGAGEMKSIKAYSLQQQTAATAVSPAGNNVKQLGHIIGQHNDKPGRFENPGKA